MPAHVRGGGMRAEKRRAQIDVDDRVPVLDPKVFERSLHVDRRHVDQDVEAAELLNGRRNERGARGGLGEIGLEKRRAAP